MNYKPKLGDLIDVRELCKSMGYPYCAAMYVGIGNDAKQSSSEIDLDRYPLILKWFCNHKYKVIKVEKEETRITNEEFNNLKKLLENYQNRDDVLAYLTGHNKCLGCCSNDGLPHTECFNCDK